MSSYFQSIRRLKDAQFYINEITRQFAVWKATQDQVDNPAFKSYQRASTNRLICKEQAAIPIKKPADEWQPQIPQEPDGGVLTPPSAASISLWINFDHELEDRSRWNNDGLFEFTNNQPQFIEGPESTLNFALDFNHNSNATFDKIWVPFSNSTQIVYDTPSGFSIFTRIKPWVVTEAGQQNQPAGPAPKTNRIQYYGGPVFNRRKLQVYNIFWGSGWNDTSGETWWHYTRGSGQNVNGPSIRSAIINQMQQVCDSEYWDGYWGYYGYKVSLGTTIGANVTNTSVPYPMSPGENLPSAGTAGLGAEPVILAERDAGHVPNWDNFGELMTDKDGNLLTSGPYAGAKLDYSHIYVVHLDPRHLSQVGSGGFAWKSWTPGPPAGTVYYSYCVLMFTAPEQTTEFSIAQHQTAVWVHELTHQIGEGPGFSTCAQGVTGFNYHFGDVCTWTSHIGLGPNDGAACPQEVRTLSGNQALVPRYWSDMDGKCICPGTGESWTRPPAGPPPSTNNPNIRRYIFQKLDDLDNGATAAYGSDGAIYFNVKKAGVEYKVKSAAGIIRANEWYDLWFGFDYATNAARIFVNSVFYNTASTEALLWNNTHSHFIIGNYNLGGTTGQMRAAMDDFRLYRNSVVSSDQVENLATNGLTISNIEQSPEVSVAVVNRVRIGKPLQNTDVFVPADTEGGDVAPPVTSFSTDSFSSTSFTTA